MKCHFFARFNQQFLLFEVCHQCLVIPQATAKAHFMGEQKVSVHIPKLNETTKNNIPAQECVLQSFIVSHDFMYLNLSPTIMPFPSRSESMDSPRKHLKRQLFPHPLLPTTATLHVASTSKSSKASHLWAKRPKAEWSTNVATLAGGGAYRSVSETLFESSTPPKRSRTQLSRFLSNPPTLDPYYRTQQTALGED